ERMRTNYKESVEELEKVKELTRMCTLEKKQSGFYPQFIQDSVEALIKELEKHVPHIRQIKYDLNNLNSYDEHLEDDNSIFSTRMQMGLYIELIRAGVIK
ncbi:MAG TPA: hypothetical protein VKR58_07200, partial [Aquella sp.]|nr:hypothetical protein [Aquella sp.]